MARKRVGKKAAKGSYGKKRGARSKKRKALNVSARMKRDTRGGRGGGGR